METRGFEKLGKATLFGFIVFALIVIWVVNAYILGNESNKKNEQDLLMGQAILQDSKNLDKVLYSMQEQLFVQKKWLEKIIEGKWTMESGNLVNQTVYNANQDISTLDGIFSETDRDYGNIIFKGDKSQLSPEIANEINQMESYFALQNILTVNNKHVMNCAFYSKNRYILYYPYIELGITDSNYDELFMGIDNLIDQLKEVQVTDTEFDVDLGWDTVTMGEEGKNYSFSTSIPVIDNYQIVGILNGSIRHETLDEVFISSNYGQDIYVIDNNEKIVFTNNQASDLNTTIQEAFSKNYNELEYYTNKFPSNYEVRTFDDYTLYITSLSKDGYSLVFVTDNHQTKKILQLVFMDLFMVGLLIGIIYYSVIYSKIKRDRIENIIENSKIDGMTELLNHKYTMEAMKKIMRNKRIRKFSVLMMDIDNFKAVNDTYGHGIGDDVIKICALTVRDCTEGISTVCGRYGGEEFLVVLNRLEKQNAIDVANQIREQIHSRVDETLGLNVTISIGLYFVEKPIEMNIEELVDLADKNLYLAKHGGKNQVVSNNA